jgi:hypothetical protein
MVGKTAKIGVGVVETVLEAVVEIGRTFRADTLALC